MSWGDHNTVYQVVAWNRTGWIRPEERYGHGAWNQSHGWAGEDWNFDTEAAVDGWVYGFGQGRIGQQRLRQHGSTWNVVFYANKPEVGHVLVGAYRNATYFAPSSKERDAAWSRLKASGVVRHRRRQLRAAFADANDGRRQAKVYLHERPVRWMVRSDDVLVFPDHPQSVARGLRYGNCYFQGLPPLGVLASALRVPARPEDQSHAPDEPLEGAMVWRYHRSRERDAKVTRAFKKSRARPLRCDACENTHQATYGHHERLFEVHHTLPLGDRSKDGAATLPGDLALLCANCHRFAHETGHVSLPALRLALTAHAKGGA